MLEEPAADLEGIVCRCEGVGCPLFATTHSAECIRVADEGARQSADYDLAVIRLDRVEGDIKATVTGEETLRTAKEFDWELR